MAYTFISSTVQVTVAANQSVHVWATAALGSTAAGGASNLRLAVCSRLGAAGTLNDNGADYVDGIRVPQNTRTPYTLSTRSGGSVPFGGDQYVYVYCHDHTGTPTDGPFTVSYQRL